MKIFITILIVFAAIIALFLIIAIFTKKSYSLEREIIINKPVQEVFNYVKYMKNQEYYSKWVMTDPNMKKNLTGTDGTAGFIYAWDGNKKAGKGEQEIMKITEGERIDMEVRFEKPFEGIATTYITTTPASNNQTKVKWALGSTMKYPMNLMLIFMNMDKVLGKDIETSLANLKVILEK